MVDGSRRMQVTKLWSVKIHHEVAPIALLINEITKSWRGHSRDGDDDNGVGKPHGNDDGGNDGGPDGTTTTMTAASGSFLPLDAVRLSTLAAARECHGHAGTVYVCGHVRLDARVCGQLRMCVCVWVSLCACACVRVFVCPRACVHG